MPFVDQFRRCMNLPNERNVVENFLVQSINVSHRNLHDGVYIFPTELLVIGEGGKADAIKVFKPVFDKRISLFTEYGSLYQCRYEKPEIETVAPKKFKITATGIGCRIYPKQELDAFIQFLKESTGFTELNSTAIISTYLNYYQKILQC